MFDILETLFPEPTIEQFRRAQRMGSDGQRRDQDDGWEIYVNANQQQRERLFEQLLRSFADDDFNEAVVQGFVREIRLGRRNVSYQPCLRSEVDVFYRAEARLPMAA